MDARVPSGASFCSASRARGPRGAPAHAAMSADDVPQWLQASQLRLRGPSARGAQPKAKAVPSQDLKRLRQHTTRSLGFCPNRAFMVLGRPVVAPQCRNVHRHKVAYVCAALRLACACIKLRVSRCAPVRQVAGVKVGVCGRLVFLCVRSFLEALVITHELSPPEVFDTYLYDKCRPVRPILSYGRCAKMEPHCKPHLAVWHWWQDSALCERVRGCRNVLAVAKVLCSCADRQRK